jgi:hypothetical protein
VGGAGGGRALSSLSSPHYGPTSLGSPRHAPAAFSLSGTLGGGGGGGGGAGARRAAPPETLSRKLAKATLRQLESLLRLYKDGAGAWRAAPAGGGGGGDAELVRLAEEAVVLAHAAAGQLADTLALAALPAPALAQAAAEVRRLLVGLGAAAWGRFETPAQGATGGGDFSLEPVAVRGRGAGESAWEDALYSAERLALAELEREAPREAKEAARETRERLKRVKAAAMHVDPFSWVLQGVEYSAVDPQFRDEDGEFPPTSWWRIQRESAKGADEVRRQQQALGRR